MPASHRIDVRAGVVFSVFEGHVTNEELLGHQQRLFADPDFRPTMNQVIDAGTVHEETEYAWWNVNPSRARRSRVGVTFRRLPRWPT